MKLIMAHFMMVAAAMAASDEVPSALRGHHKESLKNTELYKVHHRELCGISSTYDLIAGGGTVGSAIDVGDVTITDLENGHLKVCFSIGDLTPDDPSDDGSLTVIMQVHVQAGCSSTLSNDFYLNRADDPVQGHFEVNRPYSEVDDDCVEVLKPDCEDDLLVAVHADVEKQGGMDAVNSNYPIDGVQFRVLRTDAGDEPDASYWDIRIPDIAGMTTLNGYCVDTDRVLGTGTYTGSLYSYQEWEDLPEGTFAAGENPENLQAVAWLINHFKPSDVLSDVDFDDIASPWNVCGDGVQDLGPFTSGDIQRAIWMLVENNLSTAGLGTWTPLHACYLYHRALDAVEADPDWEPGCGEYFPLILIVTNGGNVSRQVIFAQVTFVMLEVPCVGFGESAWAVMGDDDNQFTNQFPGRNWATYVEFPKECTQP